MSNYYEVLGVSRDASPEEIKKAYREKAHQPYPDVAGPGHEDEFEEVSSVYEVLSDAGKRQMYDLGGEDAARGGGGFGSGFAGADLGDLGGIFQPFSGGGAVSCEPTSRARRGQDVLVTVDVEPSDVAFGAIRSVPIDTYVTRTACDGSCYASGTEPVTCPQCNRAGNVQRMIRTLLGQVMTSSPYPGCQGYGIAIVTPCKDRSGEGRTRVRQDLETSVPVEVSTGTRIRISERDEVGPTGGPSGDPYLEIHEKPHEFLERDDDGLYTELRVPVTTVALGAVFSLQTLDGEQNVTVKAGSQPGDGVALDGLGVGRLCRKSRGDLHVSIVVETLMRLDDRQCELLAELVRLRGEDDVEPVHDSSVMDKLGERFSGRWTEVIRN